ncbi:Dynamin family-domain-containing protein [Suillus variegatus]|nr:Dynamin family-domain-containing protein [Suillus variegatus]
MLYELHDSADNISYTPEAALQAGLGMVKTLKAGINKLELGSKLRKDVWLREIDNLLSQGAPTTMIAVCGATGAGKSSILNAILDDNIVPTSGMRACTAVVTEIAYHAAPTIDADVSFLSEAEWRAELAVLLDDLVDEDGNVKRTTDLRSDSDIANVLGTTKKISAKNSTIFAQEIAKYIDSKDQKRGGKKDKTKVPDNSLMSILTKDKNKETKKKDHGPALWPLIRQVNVRCNAQALSTGAILVDLPGVADANAARNSIAKDYMKKCNCIWILAPITRAVDDKTARGICIDSAPVS